MQTVEIAREELILAANTQLGIGALSVGSHGVRRNIQLAAGPRYLAAKDNRSTNFGLPQRKSVSTTE
jgi:hypothetical protein